MRNTRPNDGLDTREYHVWMRRHDAVNFENGMPVSIGGHMRIASDLAGAALPGGPCVGTLQRGRGGGRASAGKSPIQ